MVASHRDGEPVESLGSVLTHRRGPAAPAWGTCDSGGRCNHRLLARHRACNPAQRRLARGCEHARRTHALPCGTEPCPGFRPRLCRSGRRQDCSSCRCWRTASSGSRFFRRESSERPRRSSATSSTAFECRRDRSSVRRDRPAGFSATRRACDERRRETPVEAAAGPASADRSWASGRALAHGTTDPDSRGLHLFLRGGRTSGGGAAPAGQSDLARLHAFGRARSWPRSSAAAPCCAG